ncbi:phage tail fiber protein [Zooshikella sp. RANM57]|uniref:phage tail fiber domain-containing protein n=1 Tax=Zooshikella sp. RANM57 TaxID=3425863 RepID=UPI003D6F0FC4
MALSYKDYLADGQTKTFAIPFPFFHADDIKVYVAGKLTDRQIDNKVVHLTAAPATNVVVRVKRETPLHERAVDFYDGAILSEEVLDRANEQLFYVAQEVKDYTEGLLRMFDDGHFNALNRRIRQVADPQEDNDVVNLGFMKAQYIPAAKAEADRAEEARSRTGTTYYSTVKIKEMTQQIKDETVAVKVAVDDMWVRTRAEKDQASVHKDKAKGEADRAYNEANRAVSEANRAKGEAERAKDYVDKYKPGVKGSWVFSDYRNWATDDVGAGGAAFYNDNGAYKALMIAGNASGPNGIRTVKLFDDLYVAGVSYVAGNEVYHKGNITISPNAPSGGGNGFIWFKYS